MQRRTYLVTAASTLALAGCTGSQGPGEAPATTDKETAAGTPKSTSPTQADPQETATEASLTGPDGRRYDAETVRAEAKTVDYDTLFRNIESYRGESVYYEYAQAYQVIYGDELDYLQLNVSTTQTQWQGDVAAAWLGDERLLENDLLEFWAVVEGTHEYETVNGNVRTIPRLTIADYELYEDGIGPA